MSSKFANFRVDVSRNRDSPTSAELLGDVRETLVAKRVIDRLPRCKEIVVELEDDVPEGASLVSAHTHWLPWGFARLTTSRWLPRQSSAAVCPAGLVRVTISCVRKWTPGMGSHFGFRGHFWSLLVQPQSRIIWDVRSERAT